MKFKCAWILFRPVHRIEEDYDEHTHLSVSSLIVKVGRVANEY